MVFGGTTYSPAKAYLKTGAGLSPAFFCLSCEGQYSTFEKTHGVRVPRRESYEALKP
jgi:hypothetical protein